MSPATNGIRSPSQRISAAPSMANQISYSWWPCGPEAAPGSTTHHEPSNGAFSSGQGINRWARKPLSGRRLSRSRLRISIIGFGPSVQPGMGTVATSSRAGWWASRSCTMSWERIASTLSSESAMPWVASFTPWR